MPPDDALPAGPDPAAAETDGPVLAEDLALPVVIEPGVDYASPADWVWRDADSSQPNAATFHISHSEVTRVLVDALRPEDSPPEANFVIRDEIPIVVLDSLDKYWAGEAKQHLPLTGIRVPVEADTLAEAKQGLAQDLASQLRLLLMLSSSHKGSIAPALQENLRLLSLLMEPRSRPTQRNS